MRNYNRIMFSYEQFNQRVLQTYYLNNVFHRICGPAIECTSGHKEWLLNGELHRLDGPAVEYWSGFKMWFFENILITSDSQKKFEKIIKTRVLQ